MSKPPRDSVRPLKKTNAGVYSRSLGATDVGQILDEANTCLYVAKRNNRYQIVRFDQVERCRFTQAIWTSPQMN